LPYPRSDDQGNNLALGPGPQAASLLAPENRLAVDARPGGRSMFSCCLP
jgi:hypothetical protein